MQRRQQGFLKFIALLAEAFSVDGVDDADETERNAKNARKKRGFYNLHRDNSTFEAHHVRRERNAMKFSHLS